MSSTRNVREQDLNPDHVTSHVISHDDWTLNFDSMERSRQRKAAVAKRAKSFSASCEPSGRVKKDFGYRSPPSGLQESRGPQPRISSRLYVKAMDYSPVTHHLGQSYSVAVDLPTKQKMLSTSNEYSSGHQQPWHEPLSYRHGQPHWEKNRGTDIQLSYSDLSDRFSQDSAYHSRHSSSLDVADQSSAGFGAFPGSGKGHQHGRFLSWTEAGELPHQQQTVGGFVTHMEKTVSPGTARKIFEEAATRNSRPWRPGSKTAMTSRENFQNFSGQRQEFESPANGSRYDAESSQPLRTKSFSTGRPQRAVSSSMTHLSSSSVPKNGSFAGESGFTGYSIRPFYNTTTQTDPVQLEGEVEPGLSPKWQNLKNLDGSELVQLRRDSGTADVDMSAKPPTERYSLNNSLVFNNRETNIAQRAFTPGTDENFLSGVRETSPNGRYADRSDMNGRPARMSDSDVADAGRGYPVNQTSMIRRLSKELYGTKSGGALSGRLSFGGERHPRLGSIDENTQSNETSYRDSASYYGSQQALCVRRKSTSEADRRARGSSNAGERSDVAERECSQYSGVFGSPGFSSPAEAPGFVAADEGLGDGSNFGRNRKCQMSLRKAFGIFDEFEIVESSGPRMELTAQTSKSPTKHRKPKLRKGGPEVPDEGFPNPLQDPTSKRDLRKTVGKLSEEEVDLSRKYGEISAYGSSDARDYQSSKDYPRLGDSRYPRASSMRQFEAQWQGSAVDLEEAPRSKPGFSSRSETSSTARRKSESLPRHLTAPFAPEDDDDARHFSSHLVPSSLYTGTGVLLDNHSPTAKEESFPQRSDNQQILADEDARVTARSGDGLNSPLSSSVPGSCLYREGRGSCGEMSPMTTTADTSFEPPTSGKELCASPPPPVLPPRQYRKGSAGENQGPGYAATQGSELFSANDDVDSTLKRDSYARQLRQQARRLPHPHSASVSSSHLHRKPPLVASDRMTALSVGVDDLTRTMETPFEMELELAAVPEVSRVDYSVEDRSKTCQSGGGSHEKEEIADGVWRRGTVQMSFRGIEDLPGSASSPDMLGGTYSSSDLPTASDLSTDVGAWQSFPPSPRDGDFQQSSSSSRLGVRTSQYDDGPETRYRSVSCDNAPAVRPLSSSSSLGSNCEVGIRSMGLPLDDRVQEETGNPVHHLRNSPQKVKKHKKKADMAIVQPNVRTAEVTTEKLTLSPSTTGGAKKSSSPSKIGKVKGYPRPWKSVEESTYDLPAAVPVEDLPDDEKSSLPASIYDRSITIVSSQLPDKEKPLAKISESNRSGSVNVRRLPKDRKQLSKATSVFETDAVSEIPSVSKIAAVSESIPSQRTVSVVRRSRKTEEEVPSASTRDLPTSEQRPLEDEKRPTGKILPSPQQRTAADYMTRLFTEERDMVNGGQSDMLTRDSVQRASLRSRLLETRQAKQSTKSKSEEEVSLSNEPNLTKASRDNAEAMTEQEKLELMTVLEKKLKILQEEKQLLSEEITENNTLGRQVTEIVEQRLSSKELSKYRSYVDELEKVLYLLLKLSDRLAKAENAIVALPQNASDKEKAALISKRSELEEKHNDALSLKEGIDRRRHQVSGYLQSCLTDDEMKDYEYFIKMKAQLVIDQQEVEDKIEMGQRQLDLLKNTLGCDSDSSSGRYYGRKSYC